MPSSTAQHRLADLAVAARPIRYASAQRHLPTELIAEILSYLTDKPDIRAVVSTSRQFRAIMLPKLYKDVQLSSYDLVKKLSAFAACIDTPHTYHKSCGEQVESLWLCTLESTDVTYVADIGQFVPLVYHLLTKLPNLTELSLEIHPIALHGHTWYKLKDIDLTTQLSLKVLRFFPATFPVHRPKKMPYKSATMIDEWLIAQRSIERIEYPPWNTPSFRLGANAFMGLRALLVEKDEFAMVKGMVGPRPLKFLNVVGVIHQDQVFPHGLPEALENVTVLTHDVFWLAEMFPRLERMDIMYHFDEKDEDLEYFVYELQADGRAEKGNMQKVRFMRAWGDFRLSEEGRRAVGKVFEMLAGLECLEVWRDENTSTRYGRDGSSWVVQWKCEGIDTWFHDWETDVMVLDDDTPLVQSSGTVHALLQPPL